jgi:GNAT superfamily N-acetyltransferase
MDAALHFRRALGPDAPVLTAIAFAGKRHWGYPDDWIAEWRFDLAVTAEYLTHQPVVVAEWMNGVAGFAGLMSMDGRMYLEHLWLWPRYIGRGFGRALFLEAAGLARQAGAGELHIKSDPNAEAFYLRMGAVRIGVENYLLLGHIPREVPQLVYLLA